MSEISSMLGISKKTLYQHFQNKEELVDRCVSEFLLREEKLMRHLQETSIDAIDEMKNIAHHIISHFRMMKPIFINDLQKYYKSVWTKIMKMQSGFIKDQMRANLERGKQEGYYRMNLNSNVISDLYVQKAWYISNNPEHPELKNMEEFFEQHLLYHLYGILSKKGVKQMENLKLFDE